MTASDIEVFESEVIEGEIVERLFGTSPADLIDRYGPELPRSAEPDALARAERIEAGLVNYFQVRQDIADAFARRDWETLGHDSWEAYLFERFGEQIRQLVRRDPVQRVVAVQDLRSHGLSTREISEKLQIGKGTVHRDLQVPQSGAPEAAKPAPEKITGKDHKQHPAKREPKPSTEDKPAPEKPESVEKPIEASPESAWTEEERELAERMRSGETIVVSLRGAHHGLIRWAELAGRYQRIDRKTEWGNPFEMPGDGDRETVIANYAIHYLPFKPSLLAKLETLRGKALGCWCAPERCHGDVLAEAAGGVGSPDREGDSCWPGGEGSE